MARLKTEELPGVEGPGVSEVKDKKLDALADSFTEKRDAKAKLAEDMTALESKIVDRMQEIECTSYRYADREVTIKAGKTHVKIKTAKVEGSESEDNGE